MKITERHLISNRVKKNTDTSRVDDAYKDFKEEMKKYKTKKNNNPVSIPSVWIRENGECMIKDCRLCRPSMGTLISTSSSSTRLFNGTHYQ